MALLLETTLGDLTIDLDLDGSPKLCENILKLAKARYYTQCLFYYVGKGICLSGDPSGTGSGGVCWEGLVDAQRQHNGDVTKSKKRFLSSSAGLAVSPSSAGNSSSSSKGRVLATDIDGIPNTIGSQFLITTEENAPFFPLLLHDDDESESTQNRSFLSLGTVTEDPDDILEKLNNSVYCDKDGRPYTDIRIIRVHILDDPFEDPPEMTNILQEKNITLIEQHQLPSEHADCCCRWIASSSPDYKKPSEETVEVRVTANELIPMNGDNDDEELDEEAKQKNEEEARLRDAKSRAVVLEMIGDLPSADMKPPENVLFVCKLNPVTEEEDLELIFSRFDNDVHVDLIRDSQTGQSLQYAFVEFTTEQQCNEAYFKMNNALIDDRRIKVDFSQSVSKIWNKYTQQKRKNANANSNKKNYHDSFRNTNNNYHHGNNHSRLKQTNDDERKVQNRDSRHSSAKFQNLRGDQRNKHNNMTKYENVHREDYKTLHSSSHPRLPHKQLRKYSSSDDDGSERKQQHEHDRDSGGSFDSRNDNHRRSRSKERKRRRHRRSDDRKHRKKHHRRSHYDESDDSSHPRKSRKKERDYDRKESSSSRHRKESSNNYDRKKRHHDDSEDRRERRKYKSENRKRSYRDDHTSDEKKHHHRHHRTRTYSK